MDAIKIEKLCKSYPGFSLQNVSFSVPQGTVTGLVGENGAGKTTLIRLLMNAIPADSGRVEVLGVDNRSPQFAACKQRVGVVMDEGCLPVMFTAGDVETVMKDTYRSWDSGEYQALLNRFGLPRDKKFGEFSRGMKMKLSLAAAMAHHPQLLVLDEATSGLDPMAREDVLELLNDFTRREENSLLLSSHIVSDLEKICDHIAFLHGGRLLLCEEKDRLLEDYALLSLSRQALQALPAENVVARRESEYGAKVLVRRRDVPAGFTPEHLDLEQLILLLGREGKQ